jgi:segregation and condensation protein B
MTMPERVDDDERDDAVPESDGSLGPGEADLSDPELPLPREGPGLAGTAELAPEHLKGALEALILVSDKPVAAVRLARLTSQDVGVVRRALTELAEDYRHRGIALDEIAGGFQFRTSARYAPFVRMLVQQKPTKLSRAQLEVLSIIAYRQPVTRPEVDDVRGVDSGSALKLLLERNLIKIIGKRDEAGRPMLYATTTEFLELFGLKNLRDLPTLREFTELTQESRDIFERRIGEPLPGQGQGMDLATHFEAAPDSDDADDDQAREVAPAAERADAATSDTDGGADDWEQDASSATEEASASPDDDDRATSDG